MSTSLIGQRSSVEVDRLPPIPAPPMLGPVAAAQLTEDLERLRVEEQERSDRARQEAIAQLQELARFD